jgi:hypothetical protein
MSLGRHIWGGEALEAVAELVVLEPSAALPQPRASNRQLNRQLNLIAAHGGETNAEFLNRVEAKMRRISLPLKNAFLCLNGDSGWKATLGRAAIARRIAATLSMSGGQLSLLSAQASNPQVSMELLTLVELVRRDYPGLNIQFLIGSRDERDGDTASSAWGEATSRLKDSPRVTNDEAA